MKSTIIKTWMGGVVVFAAGIVVSMVGVFLMLTHSGAFTQIAGDNRYNFTPDIDGFFWTTIGVIVIGGLITLIGRIVELAAWIGALFNSYMLPGKTWFLVLLLGGMLGIVLAPIGIAVMLAYAVGAPDGVLHRHVQVPTTTLQSGPLAPTT